MFVAFRCIINTGLHRWNLRGVSLRCLRTLLGANPRSTRYDSARASECRHPGYLYHPRRISTCRALCAHPSRYWCLCSSFYVDPPQGYPHEVYNIYPAPESLASLARPEVHQRETQQSVVVQLSPAYPSVVPCELIQLRLSSSRVNGLCIDEPVYPWNLESIYPAVKLLDSQQMRELPVSLPGFGYPHIEPCECTPIKMAAYLPLIHHRRACVSVQSRLHLPGGVDPSRNQAYSSSSCGEVASTTDAHFKASPSGPWSPRETGLVGIRFTPSAATTGATASSECGTLETYSPCIAEAVGRREDRDEFACQTPYVLSRGLSM